MCHDEIMRNIIPGKIAYLNIQQIEIKSFNQERETPAVSAQQ
jgi:hypothetical protein